MYSTQWSRFDNAAKIFPPSTSRKDTKVFRFCCELREDVDRAVLQHALERSLDHFPFYRSIIRRGFFWYYFEKSDLRPELREEYKSPCALLYDANRKNLLFEVTFYRKRINLEIYHALSDGAGAVQFLKTIVYNYLLEKHRGDIDENIRLGGDDSSHEQKSLDAFNKYYSNKKTGKMRKLPRAYCVRGERRSEARLGIIEGHVSVAGVLARAHEYQATISELLTTLLIGAFHEGMTLRDEVRPVSVTIPVDLRKYFATPSTRNFFGTINVSHNFSTQGKNFEDILARVKDSFKAQLVPEKLHERLNQLSSFEHVLPIKMVPLAVKVPVLRGFARRAEKEDSTAFSNIGKLTMPAELVPYIKLFSLFVSTKRPQICICSFEDTLVISFSSPLISSDIQRAFFRSLSGFGLDVEIVTNTVELRGENHALLS